jgi:hypothetical protein
VHQHPEILNPFNVRKQTQIQIKHIAVQSQFVARAGVVAVNFNAVHRDAFKRRKAKLEHLNGCLWLHFYDVHPVQKIHSWYEGRCVARYPLQSRLMLKQARGWTEQKVRHRATDAKRVSRKPDQFSHPGVLTGRTGHQCHGTAPTDGLKIVGDSFHFVTG